MPSRNEPFSSCRAMLADRDAVPDEQIHLFCEILQFHEMFGRGWQDAESRRAYTNYIRPLLPKLKYPLARPPPIARKLLLPKQTAFAPLCDMHKGLNADFVRQWFKFLSLEVGARLETLRCAGKEKVGHFVWDSIVEPLTRLHLMWLTPEEIRNAIGQYLSTAVRANSLDVTFQPDRCEACMLARIGSHMDTVCALRAIAKSRITLESAAKHPNRLRLLRLIEPWLQLNLARHQWHPDNNTSRLTDMDFNTGMAEELHDSRMQIEMEQHQQRRAQRKLLDTHYSNSKKYKNPVHALDEKAIDGAADDAEHDIINAYSALRATQRASVLLTASDFDRYGEPSFIAAGKGIYGTDDSSPYQPNADPAYLESKYSIDTHRNNDRIIYGKSTLGVPQVPQNPDINKLSLWQDERQYQSGTQISTGPSRRAHIPSFVTQRTDSTVWPVRPDMFYAQENNSYNTREENDPTSTHYRSRHYGGQ